MGTWTCPRCGAPFANPNASHSCVDVELDAHFAKADPAIRAAFDRLVELAQVNGSVTIVPQKTRIVLAAPMRFLAIQVQRDRLVGHVFAERPLAHRVVTGIVPDAYGTRLFMHRLSIRSADDFDKPFAALVREAASRVGRRERLSAGRCSSVPRS
jgi:Domain of unknown function (DUF5655)